MDEEKPGGSGDVMALMRGMMAKMEEEKKAREEEKEEERKRREEEKKKEKAEKEEEKAKREKEKAEREKEREEWEKKWQERERVQEERIAEERRRMEERVAEERKKSEEKVEKLTKALEGLVEKEVRKEREEEERREKRKEEEQEGEEDSGVGEEDSQVVFNEVRIQQELERGKQEKERKRREEEERAAREVREQEAMRTPPPEMSFQFETPGLSSIRQRETFDAGRRPFAQPTGQPTGGSSASQSMMSMSMSDAISCSVFKSAITKAEGKKVFSTMPAAGLLEWVHWLQQQCQGDIPALRAAISAKVSGEAAQFVRKELAELMPGDDPVKATLKGVYGRDWRRVLWRENKDVKGLDARGLWLNVVRIGGVLGSPESECRRNFLQSLPEAVTCQLLISFRSEQELLQHDWDDVVYIADNAWKLLRAKEGQRKSEPPASTGPPAAVPKILAHPSQAQPRSKGMGPCAFCGAKTHDPTLCQLNRQGKNFNEGLVCKTCNLEGHASSTCNDYLKKEAERRNRLETVPTYTTPIFEYQARKDAEMQRRMRKRREKREKRKKAWEERKKRKKELRSKVPSYKIKVAECRVEGEEEEDDRVQLPITSGGKKTSALFDTGANRSHCDVKWAVDHGVKWTKREGVAVTQSGMEVEMRGEGWVTFVYGGRTYKQKWVVLKGSKGFAVISEKDGRNLGVYVTGVIPMHAGEGSDTVDDKEWLEEGAGEGGEEVMLSPDQLEIVRGITGKALEENEKLPEGTVCNDRSLVHRFDVPGGTVVYRAPYKQPLAVKEKIHKRIMEWVKKGFCIPSKGGNMNNLALLLVAKVSGGVVDPDDYRVCLDARPLNAKNRSKKFNLPKIADVIEKAKRATMMADLDLQNAFHQVMLDEVSSELSAFTDPLTGKKFQMTKMWFGESGSATQMQKVVQTVLGMGEPGTEDWRAYVDNMLVLYEGEDVEEFAHQVRRMVEKLTANGLRLKPSKCKVGFTRMRILGHLCEKGAARIDPEKVRCFSKMQRPRSLQALRSVLGFLNYVRDYVPIVADLLGPFRELAKRRKWVDSMWDAKMDDLFQRVREVLESAPVLSVPDFSQPFVMATDASQYGVGAVLYQRIEGKVKFVAFGARALKKGQKNYPASKRELLAMLFGLKRWGEMLKPQRFEVEVDNKALVYLRSEKSFMARDWMNYVAGYEFSVTHCPGVRHILPHHLSHLYGILPGGEREVREARFEVEREERERKKKEKREEKKKRREEEKRGEVKIAEMTTRAAGQRSEGSSRKKKKKEEEKKRKEEAGAVEREEGEGEREKEESREGGESVEESREEPGREEEMQSEERKEEEERGVEDLGVSDIPRKGLRLLEKEFAELVMGAKRVESLGERKRLVKEQHKKVHEGEWHLFNRLLREGVYWKEMKRDCRREVRRCLQCLRFNLANGGYLPLRARGVKYPMQVLHVDHLGTMERVGEFQHVLVVVDAATRFVWLFAVEGVSAEETRAELEDLFRTFGWPGKVVSDGGSAFVNEVLDKLLEGKGVEREVTTPGAHEQNAPAERWIREVRAVINKKLEVRRDGWVKELKEIQEGLNNRYVKPLKSTPFDLFFARTPSMRVSEDGEEGEEEGRNAERLKARNEAMVREVYPVIAEEARKKRQEICDKKSKKRIRRKGFKVGELVMVRAERKTKQDPFYDGIFEVKRFVKEKGEYQLARRGEEQIRVKTKQEKLKRVSEREVEDDGEERYEVTRVEDMRERDGQRQFLVKWKGYRERTWEKESYLVGAEDRVRKFFEKKRKREREKKKEEERNKG